MHARIFRQTYTVYTHGFENDREWLTVGDLAGRIAITRDAIKKALINLSRAGLLEPHETNAYMRPVHVHTWRRRDEGELSSVEQQELVEQIANCARVFEPLAGTL